jgi:hypothetical protein
VAWPPSLAAIASAMRRISSGLMPGWVTGPSC